MSRHFPATRREIGAGSSRSQQLLEQAGFIRKAGASGVYTLLPLGWRVHDKICRIIYDAMQEAGVLNLQLPILQARELWEQTGRWEGYTRSKTMFTTTEQHTGSVYGLAPTAEEMVTYLVQTELTSWRELPVSLHQIGPKFRDELRPRSGLLRCREFVMSDAYSFDRSEEGMHRSFEMFRGIYNTVFERVGLPRVISVQADSGAIGGQGSAEFMALSEAGEDTLLTCESCDYGANAEKAISAYETYPADATRLPMHREPTPEVKSVEQLTEYFGGLPAHRMIKTLILSVDLGYPSERVVAVCIRGDLGVNETKLRNHLGARSVEPAAASEVERVTGAEVGFAGPIGLGNVEEVLFDASTEGMTNFLCGCNETGVHALDVNFGSDVPLPERFVELHTAEAGHRCVACGTGVLGTSRGIEVGHIFMLQRGYAERMEVTFAAEDGTKQVPWMGCYGIGTTRLLQALVEQCHDERGIAWPRSVAPYTYAVVITQPESPQATALAERVATVVGESKCLIDDRLKVSAGVKFNDADLIGAPYQIVVGRRAADGLVEISRRGCAERFEVGPEGIADAVHRLEAAAAE